MQIGHGDVLTAVARRTTGLGEPLTSTWDEDITLTQRHSLDIVLHSFVVDDGDIRAIGAVRGLTRESVATAKGSASSTPENVTELFGLNVLRTRGIELDTAQAELGHLVDKTGLDIHRLREWSVGIAFASGQRTADILRLQISGIEG